MNNYLESIESMEEEGTSLYKEGIPDKTPILEMSSDIPSMTYAESPTYEDIIQDSVTYLAPQNVIVRRYRLRK